MSTDSCRKCGGAMKPSKAFAPTLIAGMPDFPGDKRGVTLTEGPGDLVDCLKCEKCGWSVTVELGKSHRRDE